MQRDTSFDTRAVPFTMKTAHSATPAHGGPYQCLAAMSSTPLTSPRMMVYSVGQPYPPKVSPRHSPGGAASAPRQSPGGAPDPKPLSSPSYFGLIVESAADLREPAAVPRDNWASPSSSVKSFSAALPKQLLPLDANPAFEAFRRQADSNHFGRSFSLGTGQFSNGKTPVGTPQIVSNPDVAPASLDPPRQPIRSTQETAPPPHRPHQASRAAGPAQPPHFRLPPSDGPDASRPPEAQMDVDTDANSLHDSAYVSSDSKRNSEASIDQPFFPNMTRFESPVQADAASESRPAAPHLHADEHRHPRFPMALGRLSMSAARTGAFGASSAPHRAETAPPKIDSAQGMMDVRQLKQIMDLDAAATASGATPKLFLVDVRVSTYHTVSRIRGALNLCIPTTLLKRATFNLQKMQLTFAREEDQAIFASWRETSHLVVYDNSSAEKRDAIAAMNMLRKFTSEGYKGQASILRGGFKAFEEAYPNLVDRQSSPCAQGASSSLSLNPASPRRLSIAPIIGGVALPNANGNPNPFFTNIRQNMDLADGVGCIELALPLGGSLESLPAWLREASDPSDRGKKVADRFLRIELAEQARMQHAYAAFNPSAQTAGAGANVQLSGVEKGGKNRYKDILPFEHARVRLQGRAAGDCDYVNASYLHASRTNKRYIASQAPLPATFSDFWSMIWDEDVRVIVMLTAESEGGHIKSHPYWKNNDYGKLNLQLISEKRVCLDVDKYRPNSTISPSASSSTSAADVEPSAPESGRRRAHTLLSMDSNESSHSAAAQVLGQPHSSGGESSFVFIRKFALSHRDHAFAPIREVTQLHYASWPDFGTPTQPSHLLALVELANVMQRAASPLDAPKAMEKASSFLATQASASLENGKLDHLFWTRLAEPELSPDPRPVLVHCSAGCGRTGTFCTVDSVVDMLKRQNMRSIRRADAKAWFSSRGGRRDGGDIAPNNDVDNDIAMTDAAPPSLQDMLSSQSSEAFDVDQGFDPGWLDNDLVDLIAATVEDFRSQRLSTVQTLRQYVLCYETIAEWVARMQERRGGNLRGPGRARSESMRMTLG